MTGSATITINPLPSPYDVIGGGSYCAGGSGYHVYLIGSQAGVSYQLHNGVTIVGAPMTGTGGALNFGIFTTPGVYTVTAATTATGCINTMADSAVISINPPPTAYALSGGGGYCPGSTGVHILLDSSNTGINYQLYYDGTPIGAATAGINAPLDFGLVTSAGTYTIKATNATTTCTTNMSGSDTVYVYTPLLAPIL